MIFFTSDFHLDHENILGTGRPFADLEEMLFEFRRRWNEKVTSADYVYLIGDTFWGNNVEKSRKVMKTFNGSKIYLEGNHDTKVVRKLNGFRRQIHECEWDGHSFVLCHYPMLTWNKRHYGSVMLHGHTHSSDRLTLPPKRLVHVGVDAWDYTPVSAEEVVELVNTLPCQD